MIGQWKTIPRYPHCEVSNKDKVMIDRIRLAKQVKDCVQLSGTFILRSGAISNIYFDKYLFESSPGMLRQIAEEMATLVHPETDILAGLEMGGIPVATVLSQVTRLPTAFIRKEPKTYGTCKYAEGPDLRGRKVTLVEDVVSSGGAILDAVERLRRDHIEPIGVLCVIDRQTGGLENLRSAGLGLRSVFTMQEVKEIWNLYQ